MWTSSCSFLLLFKLCSECRFGFSVCSNGKHQLLSLISFKHTPVTSAHTNTHCLFDCLLSLHIIKAALSSFLITFLFVALSTIKHFRKCWSLLCFPALLRLFLLIADSGFLLLSFIHFHSIYSLLNFVEVQAQLVWGKVAACNSNAGHLIVIAHILLSCW